MTTEQDEGVQVNPKIFIPLGFIILLISEYEMSLPNPVGVWAIGMIAGIGILMFSILHGGIHYLAKRESQKQRVDPHLEREQLAYEAWQEKYKEEIGE